MPPSLKGITLTNEDPNLCAICLSPFPKGYCIDTSVIANCCGKRLCNACDNIGSIFEGKASASRCSLCKKSAFDAVAIGLLKKQAKRGRPWAQFCLGVAVVQGNDVTESDFEAVRWFRKAAAQGHPEAILYLAESYALGNGCTEDIAKAHSLAEKAAQLDGNITNAVDNLVTYIGGSYFYERHDIEMAKLVLIPLAEAGFGDARHNLGAVFFDSDDYITAEKWLVSAALQGDANSAFLASGCCEQLCKSAQARYWVYIATKGKKGRSDDTAEQRWDMDWADEVNIAQENLRKLRDICGGCGIVLDGKTRKMCKQCKTFCYCSRECQKVHWNRQGKGGHREDCMGVKDLKDKMKKMRIEKNTSAD